MVPEPQVQVQETGEREGHGRTKPTQPGRYDIMPECTDNLDLPIQDFSY